jgi:hypothetical protein
MSTSPSSPGAAAGGRAEEEEEEEDDAAAGGITIVTEAATGSANTPVALDEDDEDARTGRPVVSGSGRSSSATQVIAPWFARSIDDAAIPSNMLAHNLALALKSHRNPCLAGVCASMERRESANDQGGIPQSGRGRPKRFDFKHYSC